MTRLLVVCGPTATGKTGLAIRLARRLDGEIVNADSRQVYRYMDIGTAKPTAAQRAVVPHHLLDVVAPDEPFTLADYLERARAAVAAIAHRGHLPIVAGGTGLYVRALSQGFAVPRVPPNTALRAELEALVAAEGAPMVQARLLARLRRADPAAALTVDRHNVRRLIRAIEVAEAGAAALPPRQDGAPAYEALAIGLTGDRATLYERADRRVERMMAQGFLAEVGALHARGYSPDLPALSALGYRELGLHLRGLSTLEEAVQATMHATHRFIRRQLTWFRREPDVYWLDIAVDDVEVRARDLIARWLDGAAPGSLRAVSAP